MRLKLSFAIAMLASAALAQPYAPPPPGESDDEAPDDNPAMMQCVIDPSPTGVPITCEASPGPDDAPCFCPESGKAPGRREPLDQ